MMRAYLLPCIFIVACGSWVFAEDWTRFRGPNGSGIAADKGIPTKFAKGSGILWQTVIPGAGNSSPIISQGKIFLLTAIDGKDRVLLCLNEADGKELWRAMHEGKTAKKHAKSSFASGTPAADGTRVIVCFWDGNKEEIVAYDYQGKKLWAYNLGEFQSQHGSGVSPILMDGKVYINHDQDGQAEFVCLDAETGKKIWAKARPAFRACYSSPILHVRPNGSREIILASTAGVTGYEPQTGVELWNWKWTFTGMALRTVGSPVLGNGLVFAVSGDGGGSRHMVAVKTDGSGDITSSGLAWEKKKGTAYVPTPIFFNDLLFMVLDTGSAVCLDARTGQELWNERLTRSSVTASPVLIDGKIYVADERGQVVVFAAEKEFRLIEDKNQLGEQVYASPAVANGRLYIRGEKHLFCIGSQPGK